MVADAGGRRLRICLVRTPVVTLCGVTGQIAVPPLGLAYVAGSLEAAGHEVVVIDAVGEAPDLYHPIPGVRHAVSQGLTPQEVAARVPADADLVGVSCMFSMQWPYDRRVVEAVRARLPHVPIMVGGEQITACWRYVLDACPAVDLCVLGEGEETAVEIAERLAGGGTLEGTPGCAYRAEGRPVLAAPRRRIRAIDDIARPAWHLFPLEAYLERRFVYGLDFGRTIPMLASRGCPYQCTFCSSPQMWTTYWTARDPRELIAEMKDYIARYGARGFSFYDLTTIIKREWIVEFCNELIRENLNVCWELPAGTRAEAIDAEVAQLLYRAGLRHLGYAPESGSPAVLARIKKKIKLDRMLESMRGAKAAGLSVKVNTILGFPDETPGELLETFRFLVRMAVAGADDMGPFPYSPYPGSELFAQLERQGLVRLSEEYFHDLLYATDPAKHVSFSQRFNARQLRWICVAAALVFYGAKYVSRPGEAVASLRGGLRGGRDSRVLEQFLRARRKQEALLAERGHAPGPARSVRAVLAVLRGRSAVDVSPAGRSGPGAPPDTAATVAPPRTVLVPPRDASSIRGVPTPGGGPVPAQPVSAAT